MSYIVCLCLLIPFPFLKWFLNEKGSKLNEEEFPHHKVIIDNQYDFIL